MMDDRPRLARTGPDDAPAGAHRPTTAAAMVSRVSDNDGHIESEPAASAVVFGARVGLAQQYVDSLASEGVLRGLIGPREPGRLWTRHILNSAVVGALLASGQRIVDIGSGAGLPGIPLAISRPDCEFVLIEPLERRSAYLTEIIAALELTNCRVVRARADEVIDQCGEADVVTSRAVAPLAKLAAWSAPLLRVGGELLALKGSSAAEEIARDRAAVTATGLVDLAVVSAGAGLIEPVTSVIRGIRIAVPTRARNGRANKSTAARGGKRK
jgi:16S rRNA (guanine527-N7)-methyltransferase